MITIWKWRVPAALLVPLVLEIAVAQPNASDAFPYRGESNFVLNRDELTYKLSQSISGFQLWTGPLSFLDRKSSTFTVNLQIKL